MPIVCTPREGTIQRPWPACAQRLVFPKRPMSLLKYESAITTLVATNRSVFLSRHTHLVHFVLAQSSLTLNLRLEIAQIQREASRFSAR